MSAVMGPQPYLAPRLDRPETGSRGLPRMRHFASYARLGSRKTFWCDQNRGPSEGCSNAKITTKMKFVLECDADSTTVLPRPLEIKTPARVFLINVNNEGIVNRIKVTADVPNPSKFRWG